MNYYISDTCPWCYKPQAPKERLCRQCGHNARVPQMYCDCVVCLSLHPIPSKLPPIDLEVEVESHLRRRRRAGDRVEIEYDVPALIVREDEAALTSV